MPKVLVIAHRGASALRPEHTLAAYAKAIADGADYIEGADLVSTKDGVLIARHECDITDTTDVARHPEFASRRTTRTIDGKTRTGWFSVDFTLAEIKTLRARERLPALRPLNAAYDGMFEIPTFQEIIEFVAAEATARGRVIGLIPELKSTPFHRSIGLPTEDVFLREIASHRYTRAMPSTMPLVVQCFYGDTLRLLRGRIGPNPGRGLSPGHDGIRLLQLLDAPEEKIAPRSGNGDFASFKEMMTPQGLKEIAGYADAIGPDSRSIIPVGADGRLGAPTALGQDAHDAGLIVYPYTFRPENHFLATEFRSQAGDAARNPSGSIAEMQRYIATGIDGFFTDDPALGRLAVDAG